MDRGEAANVLAAAAALGAQFPAAVPDNPANRALFAKIRAEIAKFPAGVMVDIPWDYAAGPDDGDPPPRGRAGGDGPARGGPARRSGPGEQVRWAFDYMRHHYRGWDGEQVARFGEQHIPGTPYHYRHGWIPIAPYFKAPGDLQPGDIVTFKGHKHMVLPAPGQGVLAGGRYRGQVSKRTGIYLHQLQPFLSENIPESGLKHFGTARPHQHGFNAAGQVVGGTVAGPPGGLPPSATPAHLAEAQSFYDGTLQQIRQPGEQMPTPEEMLARFPPHPGETPRQWHDRMRKLPVRELRGGPGGTAGGRRGVGTAHMAEAQKVYAQSLQPAQLAGEKVLNPVQLLEKFPPRPGENPAAWHDRIVHMPFGQLLANPLAPPGTGVLDTGPASPVRQFGPAAPAPGDWVHDKIGGGAQQVVDVRAGRVKLDHGRWRNVNDVTPLPPKGAPAGPVKPGDKIRLNDDFNPHAMAIPSGQLTAGSEYTVLAVDSRGQVRVSNSGTLGWWVAPSQFSAPGLKGSPPPGKWQGKAGSEPGQWYDSKLGAWRGGVRPEGWRPVNGERVRDSQGALVTVAHADAIGVRVNDGRLLDVADVWPGVLPGQGIDEYMASRPLVPPADHSEAAAQAAHLADPGWQDVGIPASGDLKEMYPPGTDESPLAYRERLRKITPAQMRRDYSRFNAGQPVAAPRIADNTDGRPLRAPVHPADLKPEGDAAVVEVAGHHLSPEATALRVSASGAIVDRHRLGGGAQADTSLVTFEDGGKAVRKSFHSWDQGGNWTPADMADSEYLAGRVSDAIGGTGGGAVIRGDKRSDILMAWREGDIAGTWLRQHGIATYDPYGDRPDLFQTSRGIRIGLLDLVIKNSDRHAHNYIFGPDGQPVPIDNGSSFGIEGGGWDGPFAQALRDPRNPVKFSSEDLDQLNERLTSDALKEQFTVAGKGQWYAGVQKRWHDFYLKEKRRADAHPGPGAPADAPPPPRDPGRPRPGARDPLDDIPQRPDRLAGARPRAAGEIRPGDKVVVKTGARLTEDGIPPSQVVGDREYTVQQVSNDLIKVNGWWLRKRNMQLAGAAGPGKPGATVTGTLKPGDQVQLAPGWATPTHSLVGIPSGALKAGNVYTVQADDGENVRIGPPETGSGIGGFSGGPGGPGWYVHKRDLRHPPDFAPAQPAGGFQVGQQVHIAGHIEPFTIEHIRPDGKAELRGGRGNRVKAGAYDPSQLRPAEPQGPTQFGKMAVFDRFNAVAHNALGIALQPGEMIPEGAGHKIRQAFPPPNAGMRPQAYYKWLTQNHQNWQLREAAGMPPPAGSRGHGTGQPIGAAGAVLGRPVTTQLKPGDKVQLAPSASILKDVGGSAFGPQVVAGGIYTVQKADPRGGGRGLVRIHAEPGITAPGTGGKQGWWVRETDLRHPPQTAPSDGFGIIAHNVVGMHALAPGETEIPEGAGTRLRQALPPAPGMGEAAYLQWLRGHDNAQLRKAAGLPPVKAPVAPGEGRPIADAGQLKPGDKVQLAPAAAPRPDMTPGGIYTVQYVKAGGGIVRVHAEGGLIAPAGLGGKPGHWVNVKDLRHPPEQVNWPPEIHAAADQAASLIAANDDIPGLRGDKLLAMFPPGPGIAGGAMSPSEYKFFLEGLPHDAAAAAASAPDGAPPVKPPPGFSPKMAADMLGAAHQALAGHKAQQRQAHLVAEPDPAAEQLPDAAQLMAAYPPRKGMKYAQYLSYLSGLQAAQLKAAITK